MGNNKHLEDVAKTGSPAVLINTQLTIPGLPDMICEVQLYLDKILTLKKSQHKTYEIARAQCLSDLLRPVYKPLWPVQNLHRNGSGANGYEQSHENISMAQVRPQIKESVIE